VKIDLHIGWLFALMVLIGYAGNHLRECTVHFSELLKYHSCIHVSLINQPMIFSYRTKLMVFSYRININNNKL